MSSTGTNTGTEIGHNYSSVNFSYNTRVCVIMNTHIFYVVNAHKYSHVLELHMYRDTILEMTIWAVTIKWFNTVDKNKEEPICTSA